MKSYSLPLVVLALGLSACTSNTMAPISSIWKNANNSIPQSVDNPINTHAYTVQPGDSLYAIARRSGTTVDRIKTLNHLSTEHLNVGQVLLVSPSPALLKEQAKVAQQAVTAPKIYAAPAPATVAKVPTVNNSIIMVKNSHTPWVWPTKGKIVRSFTLKRRGIDIAGHLGQPVLAAGSGRVSYAGSGLRGYGKLILIQHDNNILTAYAHNQKILVKQGQYVKKGQEIATLGNTDATTPMLHFELRRNGLPINPLKYLPKK